MANINTAIATNVTHNIKKIELNNSKSGNKYLVSIIGKIQKQIISTNIENILVEIFVSFSFIFSIVIKELNSAMYIATEITINSFNSIEKSCNVPISIKYTSSPKNKYIKT